MKIAFQLIIANKRDDDVYSSMFQMLIVCPCTHYDTADCLIRD